MKRHNVTTHWDDDTGDVVARTCSCAERWYHDEAMCPQDDGRGELVDATCVVWQLGQGISAGSVGGLRQRDALDVVLRAVSADFDEDEREFVKAYTARILAAGGTS